MNITFGSYSRMILKVDFKVQDNNWPSRLSHLTRKHETNNNISICCTCSNISNLSKYIAYLGLWPIYTYTWINIVVYYCPVLPEHNIKSSYKIRNRLNTVSFCQIQTVFAHSNLWPNSNCVTSKTVSFCQIYWQMNFRSLEHLMILKMHL